jgi:hypothetical protein
MRALALTVAVAAVAGCTEHQTEMILVITTEGVRIPDDVHKVHLAVADRQPAGDDVVYEQDVELCNPTLQTSCFDIPVTAALYPGKSRSTDSVRVQVTAIGANGPVIDNAALFTFADKQSLRLDFVLYGNCLGNVECAKRDQACGPLDTCIDIKTGNANGGLDIALPTVTDMAGCGRLNAACCHAAGPRAPWPNAFPDMMMMPPPPDMAMNPPDLSMFPPPPDMTMFPPPLDMTMFPPPPDMAMFPPPPDMTMFPPPPDMAMGTGGMGGGGGGGTGGTGGGGGGGSVGTCDPGLQCVNDTCVP